LGDEWFLREKWFFRKERKIPKMEQTLLRVFYRERLLAARVKLAADFAARLCGLMFYRDWPGGIDGLLLYPCNSVHLFWMRFDLSLIYLDGDGRILELADRIGPTVRGTRYVLEARPGIGAECGLRRGDCLRWEEGD
jgi:uncharacterized membrane protein (UPF0127 family)